MSSTQQRLDAYLAAEARILTNGFSLQFNQRRLQEAELETIRKAIAQLQQQLAQEQASIIGQPGSLQYRRAVFS